MGAPLVLALGLAASAACEVHVFESRDPSDPAAGFNRSEVVQCRPGPAAADGSAPHVDADVAIAVTRAMRGMLGGAR